jgi:hypothetical protein
MERTYLNRVVLASVIALGIAGRAWGEQQPLAAKPGEGSSPSMARFYNGSVVNIGEFPGTLVRASCAPNGSGGATAQHDQSRPGYALIVLGDDVMHPLVPGTDEVRRELNSVGLQGTRVAVHGQYDPSTGVILVDHIVVAKSGAVHGDQAQASQDQGGGSTAVLTPAGDGFRLARCASD